MAFNMSFTGPTGEVDIQTIEDSGDYDCLIMETCTVLSETECRFHVEGFGDEEWPVDVAYDFSSVMEQLPEALAAIRSGTSTEIDFYGQGVERLLEFTPRQGIVEIRCISRTAWSPDPDVQQVSGEYLEGMLTKLASDFSRAVLNVSPALSENELLTRWASGEV